MRKLIPVIIGLAVALVSCQPKSTRVTDTIKADSQTAIVQTESGTVAGYIDNGIFNFKGIPYAKAERFMPPQKPDPWEGVRSSRSYGPVCPINVASMILNDEMEFAQQHDFGYMNESCQNLNVWTPGINDGLKRPVMVWLHGGGYTAGSSRELPTYDGLNLSRTTDVVVVSINHRLNVLGFLDLSGIDEKYKYSANTGMLDIVAALEWVNKNITGFGGDPGNITIFGQSGGGGKVGTLMHMPSAKGLFHRSIMQSGAAGGFQQKEFTQKVGLAIMEELGLKPKEVGMLKDIPHEELLAAGNAAVQKVAATMPGPGGLMRMLGWAPSLDGEVIPYQIGTPEGNEIAKNVPLMIGTNKTEFGAGMFNPEIAKAGDEEIMKMLQERYGDQTDAFIETMKKIYPEDKKLADLLDIDVMFRPGTINFQNIKSGIEGGAPVYSYLFSWHSPILDGKLKAIHCMEIAFVFNNIARNREQSGDGPEAYALADKMSRAWAQFARTGDPNVEGVPQWPAYKEADGATMFFNNTCEVRYSYDIELMKFVRE
ncbi:MAG: carboxylesterase family protein [Bacteroidota bacterium]